MHEHSSALNVGSVVSLIVGFTVVKWLLGYIRYIRSHRFTAFAICRIVLLGMTLLLLVPAGV